MTLIWKGKTTDSPSDCRPICLLTTGKLYERILKSGLEVELESVVGLSETLRFHEGYVQTVKETKGNWVAPVALGIKNAFNSATYVRAKLLWG